MFDNINILTLLPALVGAVIALMCAGRLIYKPEHPTQTLVALIVGAAICGSSVFTDFVLDGTGFRFSRAAAEQVLSSNKDNITSILELRDQIKSISSNIENLDNKVTLVSAQPVKSSDVTDTPVLEFSKDSPWSKNNWYCTALPDKCKGVQASSSGITVPKSTIDDIWKYQVITKYEPTFSVPDVDLENNKTNIDQLLRKVAPVDG
jgi:hypothetical protein